MTIWRVYGALKGPCVKRISQLLFFCATYNDNEGRLKIMSKELDNLNLTEEKNSCDQWRQSLGRHLWKDRKVYDKSYKRRQCSKQGILYWLRSAQTLIFWPYNLRQGTDRRYQSGQGIHFRDLRQTGRLSRKTDLKKRRRRWKTTAFLFVQRKQNRRFLSCGCLFMVGISGFEPETSWTPFKRATKLRYIPSSILILHDFVNQKQLLRTAEVSATGL